MLARESRLYLASCSEGDPQLERLISLVEFHALAGLRKPQSELEKVRKIHQPFLLSLTNPFPHPNPRTLDPQFIEHLKHMDNMASTLKIVAGFAMQYGYLEAAYQALHAASKAAPVGASLQAK